MAIRRPRCSNGSRATALRCSGPIGAAPSLSPRMGRVNGSEVITIERFIMEQERLYPEATGGLSKPLYDPLDGSMNIDVNVSIGTIFSIHKRVTKKNGTAGLADCLQVGKKQIAAGYILYGSSTMLVYTTGKGVHGFTLDPTIGEFLLSHPDIRTPPVGRYYSVNESNWNRWTPPVQRVVAAFKNGEGRMQAKNARYIGSLVADFHRNLISGGVFLYPGDTRSTEGKLRLLYEAAPLALVVEQAGGLATDGRRPILDLVPKHLHQKTPFIVGSKTDVEFAAEVLAADGVPA